MMMMMMKMMMTTTTEVKCIVWRFTFLVLLFVSSIVMRCSSLETAPLLQKIEEEEEGEADGSHVLLFAPPVCDDTGMSCLWECPWFPDGDYQWCGHCSYFMRCRQGESKLITCPLERPLWNDITKKCQDTSLTCSCTNNGQHSNTTLEPMATTATLAPSVTATKEQLSTSARRDAMSTTRRKKSRTSKTRRPRTSRTRRPKTRSRKPKTTARQTTRETPRPITTNTEISHIPTTTETSLMPQTSTQNPTSMETTIQMSAETEAPTIQTSQPTSSEAATSTTSETEQPTQTSRPTATETEFQTSIGSTSSGSQPTETAKPTATEIYETTTTETSEPTANGTFGSTFTKTPQPTANETIGSTFTKTPEPTANETIGSTFTKTPEPTVNGTFGSTFTKTPEPTANGTIGSTFTKTPEPKATTVNPNVTETFSPTINETSSNATTATQPLTVSTANHTNASTSPPPPSPSTTENPADKDEYIEGTVYLNPRSGEVTYRLGKMDQKKGTLYGYYNNTIHRTGWGVLEIKANIHCNTNQKKFPPLNVPRRMYATGFLEGLLTARQIWEHYVNLKTSIYSSNATLNAAVMRFLSRQKDWTRDMIEMNRDRQDPYWLNVEYLINQLDGLHDGYTVIAKTQGWDTGFHVVQLLNALGDLDDLKFAVSQSPTLEQELLSERRIEGRCSALIKLTPGFENIFIGHSTWFAYASTLRIYKHYSLSFLRYTVASVASSFSSYPGLLGSLDDFYLTDAGLGVMETTNSIFNAALYKKVIPESLLTWQRAIIANRMAWTGQDWFNIFKRFNSGTYNNQFMIVDFKKVIPEKEIEDDALWVIEQIPGDVRGADQTNILRAGYWPSYNIPFYEDIYLKSGYDKVVSTRGPSRSYQLAPRAKIFRRDSGKITNMTSFMDLLRYNDYLNDEYSDGNPVFSICARGDLIPGTKTPWGCYDTKVTDYNMSRALASVAFSGPSTSHGLKPFSWTRGGQWDNTSHIGLPDTYDFNWLPMSPSLT